MWAGLVLLLIWGFWDTVTQLVNFWWYDPYYNYCLLILPIVGYVVYERREAFQKIVPQASFWGTLWILGAGAVWLMGDLADVNVVRQTGLILALQGSILAVFGLRVVAAFLFPFFYLLFLIPTGEFLIPTLQDITTDFVVAALHLLDIPVYVEGVFLTIPGGKFHVAEACAGLRFLIATIALGFLMANLAYKTLGRQIIVVLLSVAVPVIANGVRATGIVLIGYYSGMKHAVGTDHLVYGWLFFAIVLVIFISISMTFTNRALNDPYTDFDKPFWEKARFPVSWGRVGGVLSLSVAALMVGPLYSAHIEDRLSQQSADRHLDHIVLPGWTDMPPPTQWRPYFEGADREVFRKIVNGSGLELDLYIAYYAYQFRDKEMIRYGNGVAAPTMWNRTSGRRVTVQRGDNDYPFAEVTLHSRQGNRLVWYAYWVNDKITASAYEAKLQDALAKLFNGRLDSAIMAFSIPIEDGGLEKARQELQRAIHHLPELRNILVR